MARLIPTEAEEQQALFDWAKHAAVRHPELRLMYHIPNEGKRSFSTGARMRSEGLKKGVPDICLPVPRGVYSALYIELKRIQKSKITDDQRAWIEDLNSVGNRAVICKGWVAAMDEIMSYLRLK